MTLTGPCAESSWCLGADFSAALFSGGVIVPHRQQGEHQCRGDARRGRGGSEWAHRRGERRHVTARCRWWVFSLWRRGQPCGWTVSPTLMLVLCPEGLRLVFILFCFCTIPPPHTGFFSTRRHSCFSAKWWQTAAGICPPCRRRLETSWRSWIWSCLKVKDGEGDAGADFHASSVAWAI